MPIDDRVKAFKRLAVAMDAARIVNVNHIATMKILMKHYGFTEEQIKEIKEHLDIYWNDVKAQQDAILADQAHEAKGYKT